MNEDYIEVNGDKFVSYDAISYGDYDNSSDIERGNVRYLNDQYPDMDNVRQSSIEVDHYTGEKHLREDVEVKGDIFEIKGSFGHHAIYLKEGSELQENIEQSLATYPVLDEHTLSTVQQEMKEEAFNDYGEDATKRYIAQNSEKFGFNDEDFDIDDHFTDEDIKKIWDKTIEDNPNGETFETTGFYIDLERTKDVIDTSIKETLEEKEEPEKKKTKGFDMSP